MSKDKVIVVCGPTASGKSALGIEICKHFNGEIVSADSMQIYKEMNIGTAKPSKSERNEIRHHIVDCVSVCEDYNVAKYVNDATFAINDIISRKCLPVIVGGTGLYIDSLINNVGFADMTTDIEYREKLKRIFDQDGSDAVYEMLKAVDPFAAQEIHKNNTKRVIRALEIINATGKTISDVKKESIRERKYKPVFIGVSFRERQLLYDRINSRIDLMIENGLLDEAREIYSENLSDTAKGAIGYKEFFEYFDGNISFEDACELLKKNTRNYAKRQLTWFRRNKEINWFFRDDFQSESLYNNRIINFLNEVLES